MATCEYTQLIDSSECVGDSLVKINNNFANLNAALCTSSTATNTTSAAVVDLRNKINSVLSPTVLFVPANYSTQSNAIGSVVAWGGKGTRSTNPWWSGVQTVTLNNVPTNTIGVLVEAFANVNAYANNSQRVYFYKSGEEGTTSGTVVLPSNSSSASNITQAQYNNITSNSETFRKIVMDPVHGETIEEIEFSVTFPIYTSTVNATTRQFRWFWTDGKADTTAPTSNPDYSLSIKLVGYYVAPSTI